MKLLPIAALALFVATPAAAQVQARVCTRDHNGVLNVRSALGTHGRVIGSFRNGQIVNLTGWYGIAYGGYRWHQTTGNGWVRGDYLCPVYFPAHGPGTF